MSKSALKAKPPAEVKPGHSKLMVFGRSGVGKTWFALSFPNPYYIDTEGGADLSHYMQRLTESGGAYLGPTDGSNDFETLHDQIKALATEEHQYKTLVIDSISKIYQTAIATEQERLGTKDAFGASKKPAVSNMRRLINWIDRLDMNVVFIAHEAPEWGVVNEERKEIGKMPDVWDKLIYELDLTLRIEQHSRSLITATVFKTRLTGFPAGERFDLLKGAEDVGYANFAARYGKDYIEATPQPIKLAAKKDVDEFLRLAALINLSEETREKIKEKAQIEKWEELPAEKCAELIKWIRSNLDKAKEVA